MKKLILLLALISSFAFGIEKKTPSGTTVKDKPGQTQRTGDPDVEFGSFGPYLNPTGAGWGGGTTRGDTKGTYVKIGKSVFYQIKVGMTYFNNATPCSGSLSVEGLPFSSRNDGKVQILSTYFSAFPLTSGYTQLNAYIQPNTTYLLFIEQNPSTGATLTPLCGRLTSTSDFIIAGVVFI